MGMLRKLFSRDDVSMETRRRREEELTEELGALRVFTFEDHVTTGSLPQMGRSN